MDYWKYLCGAVESGDHVGGRSLVVGSWVVGHGSLVVGRWLVKIVEMGKRRSTAVVFSMRKRGKETVCRVEEANKEAHSQREYDGLRRHLERRKRQEDWPQPIGSDRACMKHDPCRDRQCPKMITGHGGN